MNKVNRREFIKVAGMAGAGCVLFSRGSVYQVAAVVAGGSLDPASISKFEAPLLIPPAMPPTAELDTGGTGLVDYYEIAVRQFQQQILPSGMPKTTVWSYGSVNHAGTFNYPSFSLEARHNKPVRVKWINDLRDSSGNFLPHLLPVDQTLHWANPPGGMMGRDMHGTNPQPYLGPVPMVTHLHGGHTNEESDGYPEAWFLPDAKGIPAEYASVGRWYDAYKTKFLSEYGLNWTPGTSTYQYRNDQRATTLWYHDHALGITRLNVYAGPAGFYLLRGGPDDLPGGILPGPAPALGDAAGTRYYEIPVVIQDRSFNLDGSLFYPNNRAFFEGLRTDQLQIPFIPESGCTGPSDVHPIWNPEFFGNVMVVNGNTWPYLEVERRRYRLRLLNGCNARFLILKFNADLPVWQIGADGGFLAQPVKLDQLLMAPAERADVIVDFSQLPAGAEIVLANLGPDEPFGGGIPNVDFDSADPQTTGQVMQFRVVAARGNDSSTPPEQLALPEIVPLGPARRTREVSINEAESKTVMVDTEEERIVLSCQDGEPFGPIEAMLGSVSVDKARGTPIPWMDPITENPQVGDTEIWEIYNYTEDAHPIHLHLVQFQLLNRQPFNGTPRGAESRENGWKDTVIAYPKEITRVKALFDIPGLYVWHCHILEHEDNEMMRPYAVGPIPGQLILQAGQFDASGKFQVNIYGDLNKTYVLEGSSDLKQWTPVSTNQLIARPLVIKDLVSPPSAFRFYRAWELP